MAKAWTEAGKGKLEAMTGAKKTYAEIAAVFGVSRSTIAGAARRFKIEPSGNNRAKTECPLGHPLTGENLYRRPNGARDCWTCKRKKLSIQRALAASKMAALAAGMKKAAQPQPQPRPRADAPAQVMDADGNPVTLRTLERNQCRFIVAGEGLNAEYCATDAIYFGRPWCDFHQRVVYLAGTARRQKHASHRRVSGPVMAGMITR